MLAVPAVDAELEVSLVGNRPLAWYDATTAAKDIASWVSHRRGAMERAARAEERRRNPQRPRVADPSTPAGVSLASMVLQPLVELGGIDARDPVKGPRFGPDHDVTARPSQVRAAASGMRFAKPRMARGYPVSLGVPRVGVAAGPPRRGKVSQAMPS